MGRLARKLNMRDEMRFAAAAARGTQALGRTTQAAHSTIAVGDSDVPLVEAVDTAVSVGEEIPQVSEQAGLAGDDAWEAWDQSEFAKQLSEAAAQVAEDAKTTADGKSQVVRSTSAATAAGSYKDGDQWWQFSGANIVGLWLHDGAAWVQQVVTNQIIASLDAGKITSGVIAADRIGANSITTAKLASTAIDGMTITGATVRTAASGQRMQFDANGLRGFNAFNELVASISIESNGSFAVGKPGGTYGGWTSWFQVGRRDENYRWNSIYGDVQHYYHGGTATDQFGYNINSRFGMDIATKGRVSINHRAAASSTSPGMTFSQSGPKDASPVPAGNARYQVGGYNEVLFDTGGGWMQTYGEFRANGMQVFSPNGETAQFHGPVEAQGAFTVRGRPFPLIDMGTTLVPTSTGQASVTFAAGLFTTQPGVFLTPLTSDTAAGVATATNITTSGMTIHYSRSANTNVRWTAVQA